VVTSPQATKPRSAPGRAFAVCRDDDPVPPSLAGAVVAVGNFDGVHRGHQHLIAVAEAQARENGGPAAVMTFEPHPQAFFRPDVPHFRLTPDPVKLTVLERLGLDGVFVRRFDAALAAMSAADFVEGLMARDLGVRGVVAGHDFHFGRGREGTPAVLRDLCARAGLSCTIVSVVEEHGAPVSSSAIRAALGEGDIATANELLGYRWFVGGEVRHGEKRGRTLGFPTANIALDPACGLRHGIYAVRAALAPGDLRDGVASFGRRPTFDDGAPLLEVYLFDFAGDLYGRSLEVEFASFIRPEERFDSAEALVARMNDDAREAREALRAGRERGPRSLVEAARPL
jgi:riboflavin kinase/FMN adenylyltransferase